MRTGTRRQRNEARELPAQAGSVPPGVSARSFAEPPLCLASRQAEPKPEQQLLHPLPGATHEYEIDSPSKRPAASIPLSTRAPPIPILSPRLLTEVIPYEGGPWPTIGAIHDLSAPPSAMMNCHFQQQNAVLEDVHESSVRLPVGLAVKRGLRRLSGRH